MTPPTAYHHQNIPTQLHPHHQPHIESKSASTVHYPCNNIINLPGGFSRKTSLVNQPTLKPPLMNQLTSKPPLMTQPMTITTTKKMKMKPKITTKTKKKKQQNNQSPVSLTPEPTNSNNTTSIRIK